jgi:hypothetical protein
MLINGISKCVFSQNNCSCSVSLVLVHFELFPLYLKTGICLGRTFNDVQRFLSTGKSLFTLNSYDYPYSSCRYKLLGTEICVALSFVRFVLLFFGPQPSLLMAEFDLQVIILVG